MAEIEAGWAEKVLKCQRDWIGRWKARLSISKSKFGVEFKIEENSNRNPNPKSVRVFTTRIDTIYGANAIVVAAEHPIIEREFCSICRTKSKPLSKKSKPIN